MTTHAFGGFELDLGRFELRRGRRRLSLQNKAFDLLAYLLLQRERVVSKRELLVQVWHGTAVTETSLTRTVSQLRSALGESAKSDRIIRTVHGRGYQFVGELTSPAEGSSEDHLGRLEEEMRQLRQLVDAQSRQLRRIAASLNV